jgi:hypothetical protein
MHGVAIRFLTEVARVAPGIRIPEGVGHAQ